jgi:hypothetical protein
MHKCKSSLHYVRKNPDTELPPSMSKMPFDLIRFLIEEICSNYHIRGMIYLKMFFILNPTSSHIKTHNVRLTFEVKMSFKWKMSIPNFFLLSYNMRILEFIKLYFFFLFNNTTFYFNTKFKFILLCYAWDDASLYNRKFNTFLPLHRMCSVH